MIAKHANNNDIDFMELIREFPTIYNKRTKDFHDKRKRENCWKKISELLNTTTQEVGRRYKTIRTSFTRYLSKQRGKSGCGLSDTGSIDPQYEQLRWLLTHIKSRESSSNIKMAAAIEEEGTSNSLSEVGNSTEYVESLVVGRRQRSSSTRRKKYFDASKQG